MVEDGEGAGQICPVVFAVPNGRKVVFSSPQNARIATVYAEPLSKPETIVLVVVVLLLYCQSLLPCFCRRNTYASAQLSFQSKVMILVVSIGFSSGISVSVRDSPTISE